ncbi:Copia protein, partial [Mucuna pruriens]
MTRSEVDHSVFYCHSSSNKCVYLVVYVDDIVITRNYYIKISQLKQYLFNHFQTKDLGHLKYFLGIERKYALNILQETSMSNCRPVDSPMDPNMKLMVKHGEPYSDLKRYRRLLGKLIYLTITRPDISFAMGVVSQFMQAPWIDHWVAILRILRYIKKTPRHGLLYEDKGDKYISGYCDADWEGSPIDRRSTTGFCISIRGNVVSWKSKKQSTVSHSSVEAEYRAMVSATCELIWVKQLIQELKFADVQPMKLYCDNQATLHISSNPIFHERTKHIEIDYHFVWEKLPTKETSTKFVNSSNQLTDIFTKSLRGPHHRYKLYVPSLEHIIYMLQLEGEC